MLEADISSDRQFGDLTLAAGLREPAALLSDENEKNPNQING
ncbi:hypothetical protein [Novosphingobium album (ex Hu et al. 2023)]|nr:hypothetical protein [Novosphingobium album (ex Hu et al. 2023)]